MRRICRGSTAIAAVSLPAPYTTAGIFPPARTRRAAFLVPGSRLCASRMLISVAVAIIPFPSFVVSLFVVRLSRFTNLFNAARIANSEQRTTFLDKKSADRSFLVNGLNCPPNQPRDRKHLDPRDLPGRFGERNGVGHDHLDNRRVHQTFHR